MNLFGSKSISIQQLLKQSGIESPNKDDVADFVLMNKEQIKKLWKDFIQKESPQKENIVEEVSTTDVGTKVKTVYHDLTLDNGQVNKKYETKVELPDDDIESVELQENKEFNELRFDTETQKIIGIPQTEGDKEVILEYVIRKQLKLKLYINDDPRSLWKDIPSKQENKPDNECAVSQQEDITVFSASRRGRSHAQKGTPRDDHFLTDCFNGWTIAVVADGMGSAVQSNLGSRVVCESIVHNIKYNLELNEDELISLVEAESFEDQEIKGKLYDILVKSAHSAYVEMTKVAQNRQLKVSDLSTTLSVVIMKQLQDKKFVGSFQVGDGVIAAYKPEEVTLLCKIDRGEYKGQTLPLNGRDVFISRDALIERLFFNTISNETVVVLMTDGIIDPYFDNDDEKLKDKDEWKQLWDEIEVALSKNKPEEEMLEWLNFYKEGEHDDRTITIIQ